MLLLSESGWQCIVLVHMSAAQTHDRKPRCSEELGLSMWISRKNLFKKSCVYINPFLLCFSCCLCSFVDDVWKTVFFKCVWCDGIYLKLWMTRRWRLTGCPGEAACSISRIWAFKKKPTALLLPHSLLYKWPMRSMARSHRLCPSYLPMT